MVGLANLLVVVILAVLTVCGRADLAAELVVGAVVVCVLGTPSGCLLGLVMFYVCAMSRMARARVRSAHPAAISHATETPMSVRDVIVIEERS